MVENVPKLRIRLSFHHTVHAGNTDVTSCVSCYPSVSHIDCFAQIDGGYFYAKHIGVFLNKCRIRHGVFSSTAATEKREYTFWWTKNRGCTVVRYTPPPIAKNRVWRRMATSIKKVRFLM